MTYEKIVARLANQAMRKNNRHIDCVEEEEALRELRSMKSQLEEAVSSGQETAILEERLAAAMDRGMWVLSH
jgi:hypothetical protein